MYACFIILALIVIKLGLHILIITSFTDNPFLSQSVRNLLVKNQNVTKRMINPEALSKQFFK